MLDIEEMNQLLNNETEFNNEKESLTEEEKSLFEKILAEPLEKIGNAIGKVIGQEVTTDNINIEIVNASLLKETLDEETYHKLDVMIDDNLTTMIADIATIKNVNTIVTEEMSESTELTPQEKAMWNETIDQAMNLFVNTLSKNNKINMAMKIEKEKESELFSKGNMLQVSFSIVSSTIDTTLYYIISYNVINKIINKLKEENKVTEKAEAKKEEPQLEEINATVQPIKFEEFQESFLANEKENMSLLMDLQLQVSVELGKVKKPIKDILQFTQGTIVELDRLAGENVDILVSGKIIAKGEVVVVDQNFGVRITEIVLPEKRV